MQLTSPDFNAGNAIPARFTCDGDDISPELIVAGVPEQSSTLTLIVDDPDAPAGTWDHWIAFNITPGTPIPANVGDLGTPGLNSWGRTGYGGPCPPGGTHRYFFTVYALDVSLDLPSGATKNEVLQAMRGHILAEAALMGTYRR